MINPDRGDRYLETIYNADWLAQQQISLFPAPELARAIESLQPVPLNLIQPVGIAA